MYYDSTLIVILQIHIPYAGSFFRENSVPFRGYRLYLRV